MLESFLELSLFNHFRTSFVKNHVLDPYTIVEAINAAYSLNRKLIGSFVEVKTALCCL